MYFRLLHDEASGAMSYLLADRGAGEVVLIDPRAADVSRLASLLDKHRLRLRWLLRTHEHDIMQPRESATLAALGAPMVEHKVPRAEGGVIWFGDEHLRVVATPGHTRSCLSFLWRDRVFCGGLLAADACPFQRLPSLPDAMWDHVTGQIFTLPDETLLLAAHARRARAVSTVYEQRLSHPWFGGASRETFLARMCALAFQAPDRDDDHATRFQH